MKEKQHALQILEEQLLLQKQLQVKKKVSQMEPQPTPKGKTPGGMKTPKLPDTMKRSPTGGLHIDVAKLLDKLSTAKKGGPVLQQNIGSVLQLNPTKKPIVKNGLNAQLRARNSILLAAASGATAPCIPKDDYIGGSLRRSGSMPWLDRSEQRGGSIVTEASPAKSSRKLGSVISPSGKLSPGGISKKNLFISDANRSPVGGMRRSPSGIHLGLSPQLANSNSRANLQPAVDITKLTTLQQLSNAQFTPDLNLKPDVSLVKLLQKKEGQGNDLLMSPREVHQYFVNDDSPIARFGQSSGFSIRSDLNLMKKQEQAANEEDAVKRKLIKKLPKMAHEEAQLIIKINTAFSIVLECAQVQEFKELGWAMVDSNDQGSPRSPLSNAAQARASKFEKTVTSKQKNTNFTQAMQATSAGISIAKIIPSNDDGNSVSENANSPRSRNADIVGQSSSTNYKRKVENRPSKLRITGMRETMSQASRSSRMLQVTNSKLAAQADQLSQWDLYWTDRIIANAVYQRLRPWQKVNHLPGMSQLFNDAQLMAQGSLKKMKKMWPNDYNIFPKTWLFPQAEEKLKAYFQKKKQTVLIFKMQGIGNKRKPLLNKSGKGGSDNITHTRDKVFVCDCFEQVQSRINQNLDLLLDEKDQIMLNMQQQKSKQVPHYVAQKFITNPLLVHGKRFHLNLFALITSCKPLTIFLHGKGLVKFANQTSTEKFNTTDMSWSIGSLDSLFETFEREGLNVATIIQGLKDIIIKTVLSIHHDLVHSYTDVVGTADRGEMSNLDSLIYDQCFELLKFKIVIDVNLKSWLIGVEQGPEWSNQVFASQIEQDVCQSILLDTFRLVNITPQAKHFKKQIDQIAREELKQKSESNNAASLVKLYQTYSQTHQRKNCGLFERIYPIALGGKEPVQLKREQQHQRSPSQLTQPDTDASKSQLQQSRYYDGFQHGKMTFQQAPKLKTDGSKMQANGTVQSPYDKKVLIIEATPDKKNDTQLTLQFNSSQQNQPASPIKRTRSNESYDRLSNLHSRSAENTQTIDMLLTPDKHLVNESQSHLMPTVVPQELIQQALNMRSQDELKELLNAYSVHMSQEQIAQIVADFERGFQEDLYRQHLMYQQALQQQALAQMGQWMTAPPEYAPFINPGRMSMLPPLSPDEIQYKIPPFVQQFRNKNQHVYLRKMKNLQRKRHSVQPNSSAQEIKKNSPYSVRNGVSQRRKGSLHTFDQRSNDGLRLPSIETKLENFSLFSPKEFDSNKGTNTIPVSPPIPELPTPTNRQMQFVKHFKEQLNKIAESNEAAASAFKAKEITEKVKFAHSPNRANEASPSNRSDAAVVKSTTKKREKEHHTIEVDAIQKQPDNNSTLKFASTIGRQASGVEELINIHQQLILKRQKSQDKFKHDMNQLNASFGLVSPQVQMNMIQQQKMQDQRQIPAGSSLQMTMPQKKPSQLSLNNTLRTTHLDITMNNKTNQKRIIPPIRIRDVPMPTESALKGFVDDLARVDSHNLDAEFDMLSDHGGLQQYVQRQRSIDDQGTMEISASPCASPSPVEIRKGKKKKRLADKKKASKEQLKLHQTQPPSPGTSIDLKLMPLASETEAGDSALGGGPKGLDSKNIKDPEASPSTMRNIQVKLERIPEHKVAVKTKNIKEKTSGGSKDESKSKLSLSRSTSRKKMLANKNSSMILRK